MQKFRSGARFSCLPLIDAIEQSIQNRERLEREAKDAEQAKEAERQEKEAAKHAKAAGTGKKRKQRESEVGPSRATNQEKGAPGPRKRKKPVEVDRDFAEGGEELEYRPRPSKSRTIEP